MVGNRSSGADPGIYHGGGQVGSGAIIKVMGGSRISGCGGGGGGVQFRWMKSAGGGGDGFGDLDIDVVGVLF